MVMPVNQRCPDCGRMFMGSDCIGRPCMECEIRQALILQKTEETEPEPSPEAVLVCPECGDPLLGDHNSLRCDHCERLWPKSFANYLETEQVTDHNPEQSHCPWTEPTSIEVTISDGISAPVSIEVPTEPAPRLMDLFGIFKDCPMETVLREDPQFIQEMVDVLSQWAFAEREGDRQELQNARESRDLILARL